jgi:hypothetical protein
MVAGLHGCRVAGLQLSFGAFSCAVRCKHRNSFSRLSPPLPCLITSDNVLTYQLGAGSSAHGVQVKHRGTHQKMCILHQACMVSPGLVWPGEHAHARVGKAEAGGADVWPGGRTRPGQGPDRAGAGRITGLGRASIPGTGNGTGRSCEQLTRRYRNVRSCFPCVHYIANASVMSRRLDIRLACDALAFLLQGPEPLDVARKFSAQAHALWTRARQCAPIGFRFLS